jgi:hypothetical protein
MNAAMVVCCMNAALFVVMFGFINESFNFPSKKKKKKNKLGFSFFGNLKKLR